MDKKKMDDELKWLIMEWEYLTKDLKKRFCGLFKYEMIKWWKKGIIPISFLINLKIVRPL